MKISNSMIISTLKRFKFNFLLIISFTLLGIFLISCEDSAPTDYTEDTMVEALLIVGEPIRNIVVMKTQSLSDVFIYDSSMVTDASVKIIGDGKEFLLKYKYRNPEGIGYYYDDVNYLIKSGIEYKIEITLKNDKILTGKTFTPKQTSWVIPPKKVLTFPKDTLNMPSTDSLEWAKTAPTDYYLVGIKCLDTLNYGKYLEPPTQEKNRRIARPFRGDKFFRELLTMNPVPNFKTPVIWNIFKFFGKHEVAVYAPDFNFLRWYIQAQAKGQIDPLLGSITGGIGYIGSASIIRDTSFIVKNQE